MAAREARHEFLAGTAARLRIPMVALAQHADDQVELFFLRLLRGSGGEGLAGMKWRSPSPSDPRIELVRPLLDQPKTVLRQFAAEEGIRHREDASNALLDFQRNRIRHELLPLLRKKYQPGLDKIILRVMEIVGAEAEFALEAAEGWLRGRGNPKAEIRSAKSEGVGASLRRLLRGREGERRRAEFGALAVAVQRQCVRLQLVGQGIAPDFELVEELRVNAEKKVAVSLARVAADVSRRHSRQRRNAPTGASRYYRHASPDTSLSPLAAEHYPHLSAREGQIPKGFYPSAQGCEERATLGWSLQDSSTLKGLRHWRRPPEREAATLSGLVGAVGAYPRVGPPPRFPRRSNPGLRDAIPSGLAENAGQDVGNAQPLAGRGQGRGVRVLEDAWIPTGSKRRASSPRPSPPEEERELRGGSVQIRPAPRDEAVLNPKTGRASVPVSPEVPGGLGSRGRSPSRSRSYAVRDSSGLVHLHASAPVEFRAGAMEVDLRGRAGEVEFGGTRVSWRVGSRTGDSRAKSAVRCECFDADRVGSPVVLRHWRPGDRFQPIGMARPVKLQDFFTNQKVPRDRRRRLIVAATARGRGILGRGDADFGTIQAYTTDDSPLAMALEAALIGLGCGVPADHAKLAAADSKMSDDNKY